MAKQRVLQVVPSFAMGGAERMAVHLTLNLDPSRFDVAAISMYDPQGTDLEEMLARHGHRVWYLSKQRGFSPRMFLKIDRVVRDFRPHVLHTHTMSLPYALPSIFLRRIPAKLHTIHSVAEKEAELGVWPRRIAFGRWVVPVAIGDEVKAGIARMYGILDCPKIPNGIPVKNYQQPGVPRDDWHRREGFPVEAVLFVTVGRLDPGKNHAMMLEAFAAVFSADPRAHLAIVGEGPAGFQAPLEELAATLGVHRNVHFLGRREDIPDVLGAADVFLLSSDYEGNPLTVMEAMAAGRPVVSTDVGGVSELVEDGVTGLLVEKGNGEQLAEAMMRLLKAPETRNAMGQAGAARASEHFDVRIMAEAYARLYDVLAENNIRTTR